MNIQHEEKGKKGEFYIEEGGERIGKIQYFGSADGQITVYHTEVDEKHREQGIGEDLVERVVALAIEKDLRIVASCPFAKKVIEENPDFRSVLA